MTHYTSNRAGGEIMKKYINKFYPIKDSLSSNFKTVNDKIKKIFICCYVLSISDTQDITEYHSTNPNLDRFGLPKYPRIFLKFLLFKYPKTNLMIFPFIENNKTSKSLDLANQLVKKITHKNYKTDGFLETETGIYFFYNINHGDPSQLWNRHQKPLFKKTELWLSLIDEICNHHKVLSFPVHKSVYKLFYNNPFLIYLKSNNRKLPIPEVGYVGAAYNKLGLLMALDQKASEKRFLGPFYEVGSYTQAFKRAIWKGLPIDLLLSKQEKPSKDLYEPKTDSIGKYITPGGIIRYACFLGKRHWQIMYQPNDPFLYLIKAWDNGINKPKDVQTYFKKTNQIIKKWPRWLDSISIGKMKFKNLDGYYQPTPSTILRKSSQRIPLSFHIVDSHEAPVIYDPTFDYKIL